MQRIIVLLVTTLFVPVLLHAARPGKRTEGARLGAVTTSVAGRAPATFGVTNGGAAKYIVPLATPPGIGRAQPALSLVYSSQAGLGMSGYGADLGGLPVIARTRAIFAIDGFAGGINYDANDRFAFSGQRLINTSGGYGADGTPITRRSSIGPSSFRTASAAPAPAGSARRRKTVPSTNLATRQTAASWPPAAQTSVSGP